MQQEKPMTTIVELAPFKLAAGKSETDLLAASSSFQKGFLEEQPGFIRRELVRKSGGSYMDIVHWRSEADAKAVMEKVQESEACALYFSVMDMTGGSETGVDLLPSLAVYKGNETTS
jgi:heme-degrading monooxygenase HmoA